MAIIRKHNEIVNVESVSPEDFDARDRYFADIYHHLLTSSWPSLLLQIAMAFFLLNAIFGAGYLLDGGISNARKGSFPDVFFFSIETMATVGYGRMAPITLVAHLLMSIEALTGLIGFALVTGLMFAKFSRPTLALGLAVTPSFPNVMACRA